MSGVHDADARRKLVKPWKNGRSFVDHTPKPLQAVQGWMKRGVCCSTGPSNVRRGVVSSIEPPAHLCIRLMYRGCRRRVAVLNGGLLWGCGRGCGRRGGLRGKLQIAEDVVEDKVALLLDCQEEGLHEAALVLSLQATGGPVR